MYNKHYCSSIENVENYDKAKADNFIGWHCHHRLETHNSDGERRLVDISKKELIALGMYWNRPASELIFLTVKEHSVLHKRGFQKGNQYRKGKPGTMKGKHHSEEAKRKISETSKGRVKGRHWYNNGEINVRRYECPEGFVPGKLV